MIISCARSTLKISLAGFLLIFPLAIFAACDNSVSQIAPTENFINNRDGTVTDNTTGLMWSMCLYGQSGSDCATGTPWANTWDLTLMEMDYNIYVYLDYSDWRMPNTKELASILEAQCSSPALNPSVFPLASGGAAQTWTSSPDMINAQNIWSVDFFANGNVAVIDRTTATLHLRLVRDADAVSGGY